MPKTGLPPIARRDAQVLILGSLPGDASLAATQPRNQFWWLLGGAIGQDLVPINYAERIAALHLAAIALWYVVATAERLGSLDQHIRSVQNSDLRSFVSTLPQLEVIAFNGKKAASLAGPLLDDLAIELDSLPSSSPAYTLNATAKAAAWAALSAYNNVGAEHELHTDLGE